MAVDDEHALGAESSRDLGHDRRELRIVDAQQLARRAGGVGERAEDVEHGPDADLSASRAGVSHARVQRLREQEADAGLVDAARHVVRVERDVDAERLEHVGAPAAEETARLPCLATGTPAPATTNAVVVEMLNVCSPSPPVPHVSM